MSTKIHAVCDALGNPIDFHLTPGQRHDLTGADILLPKVKAKVVLADRAYLSEKRVLRILEEKGVEPIIPSKINSRVPRPLDVELYKARHLIENFFARLKQYRAIATRYDKTASAFLGAIHLAASIIWLD